MKYNINEYVVFRKDVCKIKEVKEAAGNICPGYLDKGVYKIIKNLL